MPRGKPGATTNKTVAPRPLSNWAQIASALIATVALAGIYYQVTIARHNAQHASARQVYMSYSEASLRYPEFGEPHLDAIKAKPLEYVRYKIYVTHMIWAYDEVLSVEDTPSWRRAFLSDLRDHKDYLCAAPRQDFEGVYYPLTEQLLRDFKKDNCKN